MTKKLTNQYYFSVEGETEKWYLEWLRDLINATEAANYRVSINCKIEKNPIKFAKSINIMSKTVVYHLCDYEGDEPIHAQRFKDTMDNLKKVRDMKKQIVYKFDYSNLTFDLWIILHKTNEKLRCIHRDHYVRILNRVYGELFENMDQFKHEENFKRVLKQLTLDDVIIAVRRAKSIIAQNENDGYTLHEYKGSKYYKENPATMVWEPIEKILTDCGLMLD